MYMLYWYPEQVKLKQTNKQINAKSELAIRQTHKALLSITAASIFICFRIPLSLFCFRPRHEKKRGRLYILTNAYIRSTWP